MDWPLIARALAIRIVEVYNLTLRFCDQITYMGPGIIVHNELQSKYWNLRQYLYKCHGVGIVSHQVRSGSTLQVSVVKQYRRLAANA